MHDFLRRLPWTALSELLWKHVDANREPLAELPLVVTDPTTGERIETERVSVEAVWPPKEEEE